MNQNRKSTGKTLRMLGCAFAFGSMAMSAQATCTAEPYIGSVCMTAAMYCPQDYAEANGALLPIMQYQALYSLIGTTYGGDARTTFGLPDLRGRAPVGLGLPVSASNTAAGVTTVLPGAKYGAETVNLSTANLPPHNHTATLTASQVATSVSLPVTGTVSAGSATATATVSVEAITTQTAGGSPTPSSAANTLGKIGNGQTAFFPYDNTKAVAVPATATVTVTPSAGTFSGTAAGNITLTPSGTIAVGVTGSGTAVSVAAPRLGMRMCIALNGLYPPRP